MKLSMVMAFAGNGIIGMNGSMPWKCSTDMTHFRNVTMGEGNNAVIMGRKTWDSLPGKGGLPGRLNMVVSTTVKELDNARVYESLEEAIADAKRLGMTNTYLIGGSSIFAHYKKCDEMWLSYIHEEIKPMGTVVYSLPDVDPTLWRQADQQVHSDCTITRFLKR
jgi:dihydrofolate reductase